MIGTQTEPPTTDQRPYQPCGAARDLFYCRAPEILIEGPAGTGKTRAVLEKLNIIAENYPGCRILLVRKTRESMTETVLVTWETDVVAPRQDVIHGAQRRVRQAYSYPNGSEIVVGGLDKPGKVMSSQYDIIAAFEAVELTEDAWEHLGTRLRNHVVPYQQQIADCNPWAPTHWLNQRATAGRITRLLSRHEDNPSVTPEYLAKLDNLTGVRHARLRLGIWAAAEGLVYDGFDPAIHVIPRMEIPAAWRRVRCVDFGYTNPFVCQWWAIDDDGRMYLYRELYQTRRLVEDHARDIARLSAGENIEATVADHDAEDRATLERHGISTRPAHKAVQPGIEAVAQRLRCAGDGKPRLFLLADSLVSRDEALAEAKRPLCTVDEISSYAWAKNADGKPIKEQPNKIDDHGMDAMRYAVAYVDHIGGMALNVHTPAPVVVDDTDARIWKTFG